MNYGQGTNMENYPSDNNQKIITPLNEKMVFTDSTINIFTDASEDILQKEDSNGNAIARGNVYPGFIAYRGSVSNGLNSIYQDCTRLIDATNNQGEIYAIKMTLQYLIWLYRENYNDPEMQSVKRINIFADSLNTVRSLTIWNKNWVKQSILGGGDILRKGDGQPAMNAELLSECLYLIQELSVLATNIKFRIFHISGHGDKKTGDKDPVAIRNKFITINNLYDCSMGLIDVLIEGNVAVDNYTRIPLEAVKNGNDIKGINLNNQLLYKTFNPTTFNQQSYERYLGVRRNKGPY